MNELDLFAAAIAIADQKERTSLLDRECVGRPDVRQRIDQLLDAHFQSHPLLDQPGPELTGAFVPNEEPGVVIAGRYKLLEQIGEGGMGAVWVAEQTQPVRRKVALKLIKAGMDSKSVIARFEAERQALAVMDHPNVAKVLDGGLTETGRPFFVMEYVKGVPITEYCDAARLNVSERLQLFTQVCRAVQHAHQKGIIHRDLKPSNILVAPYDDKPVPKIIDFGLAKAMHQSLTEKTLHTAHESVLGTPLYMSPEQAQLNNIDVDTRSDVYSLGVVLYELLTGTTPLERKRFKEAAWDEMRRIIREEEPPRPSTRLSSTETLPSLAACRHTEPLKLTKQVRGELDWIVMKALEKDRARRYETANGFAADVLRYLSGEPVLAAPPSARYRLKKFVRRHRGPLMAASVVVLALSVGAATVIAVQVRANRELAVKNRELAEEQAKLEARNRELADEQAKVLARETQAINAVRRFGDVVSKNEALKNNPELESLRKELLKEPLAFFRDLRKRLQADRDTSPESLDRLANASHELSILTRDIGDLQDALIACRETLAIDQKLVDASPEIAKYRSNLAESYDNVADLLSDTGKSAEAEAEFRRAIALRQKLADDYPDVAEYRSKLAGSHHGLAGVLSAMGRPAEAEAEYRRAIALSQKAADDKPADSRVRSFLANHHHNLGVLLMETGQSAKADAEYRTALAIKRKLADENPDNTEFRIALADSHLSRANLASITGKPAEAEAEYRKALAVYQQLADEHPSVTQFRSRVALGHYNLVGNLMGAGKTAEAETEYHLVLGLYQKLADGHPSVTEFRNHLAKTHTNLAILRAHTGNPAEAEVEIRAALAIMRKLADDNPTVTEYRSLLAGNHHDLGAILAAAGKPAGAEAEYRKAIALSQKATDEDPTSVQFSQFLANHHLNLGNLLRATGRPAEAEAEYRKSQAMYRKLVDAEPAVTHNVSALALIHNNLGGLLLEVGRPAEAAAEFRQALELNPDYVRAKTGLTQAQRQAALLDKIPALLKGDYKPTSNGDRIAFAQICLTKKQFRAAAGLYADAFAADPRLADNPMAGHRYNAACCASLAAGPGEDAAKLDDEERTRLRKQALGWLRADLALNTKKLESDLRGVRAAVPQQMKHWQQDPDLAGIRDADALAKLPADEQKSFTQLWSDVAELLKKAEKK